MAEASPGPVTDPGLDLRQVAPGQVLGHSESVSWRDLAPGVYSLRTAVESVASGRPGLVLQSGPRDALGRVILGSITLLEDLDLIFSDGFETTSSRFVGPRQDPDEW